MSISHSQSKTRLNSILDSEVLERVDDKMKQQTPYSKRKAIKNIQVMPYLTGKKAIAESGLYYGNIERFCGLAQIPVGLVGPLNVKGAYAIGAFDVPLATTEATLVASYHRGAKVISHSGGVRTLCISQCMTRSPGFVFKTVLDSAKFVAWCYENFPIFKDLVKTATRHGHLEDFDATIDGKYVWLNFKFTTKDAAGQNMVTISTDVVCQHIVEFCPMSPEKWYIDANLSGDKKASSISQYSGRGRHMLAEITVPAKVVKKILHTTPEAVVEYSQMAMVGGILGGALGINGHFANALTALLIACGQDAACAVESSQGMSRAELTVSGDLYVSISLPNLVVGTVGGGTHLPTQRECLEMMDCYGNDKSAKFAEICAATVLAGELSIGAAITAGHFTRAHIHYGRKTFPGQQKSINQSLADQSKTHKEEATTC